MRRPDSPLPPPGRLTTGHFRMKGQYSRWREKGASGWLIVCTLGGKGRFGHAGGELLVEQRDMVLLRPKVRNDYGLEPTLRQWDLLWAYFFPRADWLPLLAWPEAGPGIGHLHLSNSATQDAIIRQLWEVHELHTGFHRRREMLAMNALEKLLLLCESANPRSDQACLDNRVLQAMDYLCRNLAQPITIETLARACSLSASRLAHLFTAQVGQTPRQFLELQRLARARQLLELTQQPISAVAAESGFPDLFHFSKRFKRHFELSPRHYRQAVTVEGRGASAS